MNISFYTVPAAFFLTQLPHFYSLFLARSHHDNTNPRGYLDAVTKSERLDKRTKGRVLRAEAATANGLETLGFFAGSVVAANISGVPAETINALTLSYIATRAVYVVVYVWIQENPKFAGLRTLAWQVGCGLIVTLYVKAGLRM